MLLPAALVAALSRLVAVVIGRLFARTRLVRAVPRAEIWWISAGSLGLVLAIARTVAVLRFRHLASMDDE
ncbi:hypothetical protein [Actinomadura bangladeshensis]|uniref:Uncharacterized protein n=1 Tax=Actinomadura bangladeshensis TaxID=453573 RepID=A0A4R4N309_9ACTN|nr:hypothetical protein [Actinomadura bangladeshensis]TDC03015.1 hypothetical protein E1284_38855 [Actinomadura bangladeshensis]